ncbi:WAT1-related protein [Vitis vinifera]|uniref:WAT1-related protein n=1 Tax=Vitis vinifera TaxID=29760 RepID=A0A438JNJ1_VITVI|nr:WAT1-related protein [Vitis vinifera]
MVMAEFAQVGLMIASKAAISSGMPNLVFILYSNTLASLILLPSCLLFQDHRVLNSPSHFQRILLACPTWIFGYAGIQYSSATLGTAMLNSSRFYLHTCHHFQLQHGVMRPIDFWCLQCLDNAVDIHNLHLLHPLHKNTWKNTQTTNTTSITIHRLTSTLRIFVRDHCGCLLDVSIAGAFIVTFYKGSPILMTPSPSNFPDQLFLSQQSNWVSGGLLLAADCVMSSAWLILQASILKKYPAELIINFYYCFFVAIQSAAASLIMERGPGAWSLKPSTRFIAVMYSGVFGYVFQVGAITWCVHQKGPVFVAMFKPVGIVVAVAMGSAGDISHYCILNLCSLIGATVIVIGFYSVMWGKAKEEKIDEDIGVRSLESTSQKAPLLQNYIEGLLLIGKSNGPDQCWKMA